MRSDIFSPDDMPDSFWSPPRDMAAPSPPPPGMNRSHSEWALEKFLEEISSVCVEPLAVDHAAAKASGPTVSQSSSSNVERKRDEMVEIMAAHQQRPFIDQIDSEQYHAYLKSQLDIACAAVALARTSSGMAGNSADLTVNDEKGSQLRCQSDAKGANTYLSSAANEGNVVQVDIPAPPVRLNTCINEADSGHRGIQSILPRQKKVSTSEADSSPVGIPALPDRQKQTGIQGRQTISESSREDSDDDEVEGDNDPENMDPAESKRARRMLSNRESARRSRRRKQEQMNELETQVGQLKVEHTTLVKRLTDINRKCDEAAVDNRVLKADIETLRAKVKMAEETVKRVTGINPLLLAMSKTTNFNLPHVSNTGINASANTSTHLQQSHNQFHQQPLSSIPAAPVHDRVKGGFDNISSTPLANPSVDVARSRLPDMPPAPNFADRQCVQNNLLRDERTYGLPAVWQPEMSHLAAKKK